MNSVPCSRTILAVLCSTALLLGGSLSPASASPPPRAERAAPTRSISVTGAGVGMFPAFDSATSRYAVTTTDATAGALTVRAVTSDPTGVVRIDGRPTNSDSTHLTGLQPGDEVSVMIDDSAGHAAYALFVTPAGFPALERTTPDSTLKDMEPGLTLLTLGLFVVPNTPYFETAVDANGVPAYAHRDEALAIDLKLQPNGHFSVQRTTTTPGRTGWDVVDLGTDFTTHTAYRTTGLVDTDDHDSILLPDGKRYFVAYEPDPTSATGLKDARIQETDSDGTVIFDWNLANHVVTTREAETLAPPNPDYAHINSISITPDGDILASFRHLSSVWKIARTAQDGFAEGAVEWRLGGRHSDFTFPATTDGTDGGPCAQHSATELPNGHILIWNNGSSVPVGQGTFPLCVSGTDPTGAAVARPHTRVDEYALDLATHKATIAWQYDEPNRFASFAGSVRRLDNGDSLLAWAVDTASMTDEVDSTGAKVWGLRDANPTASARQYTYRSVRAVVPDWAGPIVSFTSPTAEARINQGKHLRISFGCSDVGGSTLQTCDGSQTEGALLDTTRPGLHAVRVSATDGAGHRTTVTHHYRVLPLSRPDVLGRAAGTSSYAGSHRYYPAVQAISVHPTASGSCTSVRVQNDGVATDRLTVQVGGASRHWQLTWRAGGHDVTDAITESGYPTGAIAPGAFKTLCLRAAPGRGHLVPTELTVFVRSSLSGLSDRLLLHLRPRPR